MRLAQCTKLSESKLNEIDVYAQWQSHCVESNAFQYNCCAILNDRGIN